MATFLRPELSTSNRATLGGMINTDASGQGSLVYGKTSDHVLGVRAVLIGRRYSRHAANTRRRWRKPWAQNPVPRSGGFYRTVYQRCQVSSASWSSTTSPSLTAFLTGYDLRHVFNDDMTEARPDPHPDRFRRSRWPLLPKRGWISPACRKCAVW